MPARAGQTWLSGFLIKYSSQPELCSPADRIWAVVYGVAHSWSQLKRLSSYSSISIHIGTLFNGWVIGNISFFLFFFFLLSYLISISPIRQLFYSWVIAKNFYLWLLFFYLELSPKHYIAWYTNNYILFALQNVLRKWWMCATRQNLIMNRNVFWPFILYYYVVLQVISCFMSYGYTTCNNLFPLWKKVKRN